MEGNFLYQLEADEINELLNYDEGVKVSLTMPIQQETDKRDENRIRVKNITQMASDKLVDLNFRNPDINKFLAPLDSIATAGHFLELESPGLAIFLAKEFFRIIQLPYTPREATFVGSEFQIKPLIPLINPDDFYILVLDQNNIRLLHATEFFVERVNLEDMPKSIDEALRWDDPERQLQWHSQTRQEINNRAAMFHGHGVGSQETHKQNLRRYFQMLDQGISKLLADETAPLLLAGVDYLLPIYRQVNNYEYLVNNGVVGSQEILSDLEIQQKAWPEMGEYFQEYKKAVVLRYKEMAVKGLATGDLTSIVKAAYQGRVETLLIDTEAQSWGRFLPENGRIIEHSQWQPGDSDLLNVAAIYTIQNDGNIYGDNSQEILGYEPLYAIFRF